MWRSSARPAGPGRLEATPPSRRRCTRYCDQDFWQFSVPLSEIGWCEYMLPNLKTFQTIFSSWHGDTFSFFAGRGKITLNFLEAICIKITREGIDCFKCKTSAVLNSRENRLLALSLPGLINPGHLHMTVSILACSSIVRFRLAFLLLLLTTWTWKSFNLKGLSMVWSKIQRRSSRNWQV